MEWMVCIKGDDFDLQELSESLTSAELCIIKDGNEYFLKSTNLNELHKADEVRSKCEEILTLINGAAKLALRARKTIMIDSIISIDDNGEKKRNYFELGLEIPIYFKVSLIVNGEQEIHLADPIPDWIKLAQSDENAAKVFRLLANLGYDWVNLYRIFEIVMKDVGGTSSIEKKGWATKSSIDRFTGTADNPKASGDLARHGIAKHEPLPNPMTLSEAKSLIETVLHNWLGSKI